MKSNILELIILIDSNNKMVIDGCFLDQNNDQNDSII